MKKILPTFVVLLLLFLLCGAMLHTLDFNHGFGHTTVQFDGDDIDGPAGILVALVAGGGALLAAALAIVFALVITGVALAGVGLMLVCGLALGALVLAVCMTPLMIPLLLPLLVLWAIVALVRKSRGKARAA